MEVSKDSKFTLSLETLISIAVTIFMVVGLWFNLQADIQEAKELPEPPVSRTEYDLKDQMIRNSIMNTEEKVEKLEDKVDDIKEDTRSINETLLNMNKN
jgi:flagellar hook-associated protein FlgK